MSLVRQFYESGQCHPGWEFISTTEALIGNSFVLHYSRSVEGKYFLQSYQTGRSVYLGELQAVMLMQAGPDYCIQLLEDR